MRRPIAAALSVALIASPTPLFAWGVTAHRVINRVAVNALPPEVPPFVKAQNDWIGVRSVTPDSWRTANEPFLKIDGDPNHGWFLEQFAFMRAIPRSRYEFILALYDEFRFTPAFTMTAGPAPTRRGTPFSRVCTDVSSRRTSI